MKAITLIQPWASLIAWNEKLIETRSWWTNHRGPLAIHAGKKIDYEACEHPLIKAALLRHGITKPSQLPTSAVLSICQVFDCVKMQPHPDPIVACYVPGYKLSTKERAFGDYRLGRYAWSLANNRILDEPIPAKGKLMLWDWKGVA